MNKIKLIEPTTEYIEEHLDSLNDFDGLSATMELVEKLKKQSGIEACLCKNYEPKYAHKRMHLQSIIN